jgi:HSP20 family protein
VTCSAIHRLQRQISSLLGGFPTGILSGQLGAFPSVNIGTTDETIEIVAFATDIHPAELEVSGSTEGC